MTTRSVDPCQSRIIAGVARGDITPPVGIYHRMWGAATHDKSTGIHRPLTATVLTLEAGDTDFAPPPRVAIAVDHCLLWTAEMRNLIERIAQLSEVPTDSLIVFFSHTHGAGLMGMERRDLPGGELIPPYLDSLATRIAGLVEAAFATAQAATISYADGRCSLAQNRDFYDAAGGQFVCGFNPAGEADDRVLVGRVNDRNGQTIATLVNYACHPTTLAWDNTLISPDYVGAMREVIEMATGAPCFFIQGASGDVGPREGFVGDVAVADRNGRQLGYAALSALTGLPPSDRSFVYAGPVVSGATIGTWRYEPIDDAVARRTSIWRSAECVVELPLRDDLPRRDDLIAERDRWQATRDAAVAAGDTATAGDARAMIERVTRRLVRTGHLPTGNSIRFHVSLWRCGNAIWVPLNGEHYNVLQTTLRSRFPEQTLVIGTLANGSDVWYLPDAESYGKGLYQEEASILAQGSLEILIDALTGAIRSLITTESADEPAGA